MDRGSPGARVRAAGAAGGLRDDTGAPSKRSIEAVLVAIAIAALSIFAVLQQIGQPFVRILAALYRMLI